MRDLPDIRKEMDTYFDAIKATLIQNVKEGKLYSPVSIFVKLTSKAQEELKLSKIINIVPTWDSNKGRKQCIENIVNFSNSYAESLIWCGSGRGVYSSFGEGEVSCVFVTIYLPGYNPWTRAQIYAVVEREVIFDIECCSADRSVDFFDLPGLWPEGIAPE